jgi:hypothetical protein
MSRAKQRETVFTDWWRPRFANRRGTNGTPSLKQNQTHRSFV